MEWGAQGTIPRGYACTKQTEDTLDRSLYWKVEFGYAKVEWMNFALTDSLFIVVNWPL